MSATRKPCLTHCYPLIIRAQFYFRRVKKNGGKPTKKKNVYRVSLREVSIRQLLIDTEINLANYKMNVALVYDEAWKLHTKINVLLRNVVLGSWDSWSKLGLRELNYADELRMPILPRALENEFIFVILVGIRICWIKWHFAT